MKCPKCGSEMFTKERLHPDGSATLEGHTCIKCGHEEKVTGEQNATLSKEKT